MRILDREQVGNRGKKCHQFRSSYLFCNCVFAGLGDRLGCLYNPHCRCRIESRLCTLIFTILFLNQVNSRDKITPNVVSFEIMTVYTRNARVWNAKFRATAVSRSAICSFRVRESQHLHQCEECRALEEQLSELYVLKNAGFSIN